VLEDLLVGEESEEAQSKNKKKNKKRIEEIKRKLSVQIQLRKFKVQIN